MPTPTGTPTSHPKPGVSALVPLHPAKRLLAGYTCSFSRSHPSVAPSNIMTLVQPFVHPHPECYEDSNGDPTEMRPLHLRATTVSAAGGTPRYNREVANDAGFFRAPDQRTSDSRLYLRTKGEQCRLQPGLKSPLLDARQRGKFYSSEDDSPRRDGDGNLGIEHSYANRLAWRRSFQVIWITSL
ncbi:hypothetical protein C8F01DRAFT_1258277 [Mycena amicta]|nr:hypothetical protein C8F01DRAFT_1258277 [Mycena amicta]